MLMVKTAKCVAMKLTAILLIAGSFTVCAATGTSQNVSFSGINVKLESVFQSVKEQTGYVFMYSENVLQSARPVSVSAENVPLEKFLRGIFKTQPLDYVIREKSIFISPKQPAASPATRLRDVLEAENKLPPVRIHVTDESGQSLAGASITVKNSANSAITDPDGYVVLNVKEGDVIEVSFVGHQPRQVKITSGIISSGTVSVALSQAVSTLDETVVIAYGTTTKRLNTGNVSSVTSSAISSQPVLDPVASMQARVPGLFITSSNGLPGSNFNVQLRGINSLSAGTEPLYVVDGVPYFSEPMNQFTSANGYQSPLASINPNDIERIDVLKDADATAIYGSRAANGVILITTKKGRPGKTSFNFNVFSGGSKIVNKLSMLNTSQYLAMRKEAFANDGIDYDEDNAPDLKLWSPNQNTDWQDYMIGHTAKETQIQGSVSGGNEQTRFLLSGTFRKATTVMPGDLSFKRASAHFNIDHTTLDKKFNITASLNYSSTKDNSLATDLTSFYDLAPNYPLYDSVGDYYWFGNIQNPAAYFLRRSTVNTNALIANSTLKYTVLPGLHVKANLGYTFTDMDQLQAYPSKTFNPLSNVSNMTYFGFSNVQTYLVEPQVDYNRKIGRGNLQALVGGTFQESQRKGHGVTATNFSSEALLDDMYSAESIEARPSQFVFYRYTSLFGRLNYNWENRYIVNATYRRDGSTRFGPDNRFGNFGAVGAAWLFSNESFFPNNGFVSFGKLRASYGTTGNDQIGDYAYLASWSSTSFPYDGVSGLTPSRIPNAYYQWENNRKLEGGVELGFLKDRILFNASVFRNISDNLLVDLALSPQTGAESTVANFPAKVLNSGVELTLNTTNIKSRNFTWNTSFNMSFIHNELKEYPDIETSTYAQTYVVGQSLSIVKGFQFTGIDPQTGLPQFFDVDHSGGIADDDDYVVLGKTMPDYYGGLQNTLAYKGFTLDFLLQFVKQDAPGVNYGYLSAAYGTLNNKDLSALDRWKQAGDITNVPRATTSAGNVDYDFYRRSSVMWENASYIRLKNISLRYDLAGVSKKLRLDNLSVYLLGQNLFTITKYKGIDPETQGLAMPPLKTITAGLQIAF